MKKIINITLGGLVFAIENDAYDTLATYIANVKQNLSGEDSSEVIDDIESALAEKFISRHRSEKIAVTDTDVANVTKEMGNPSDFSEEPSVTTAEPSKDSGTVQKRLYRDEDDAVLAGVASGIANYFDIDAVIVRIMFVVSVFFSGFGIVAYIVLWLVVPKAKTTTQKYAMRGDKMTLSEITQRVKKNIQNIDAKELVEARGTWSTVRPMFVKVFNILGILLRGLMEILRYIIGIALALGGTLSLAGLVIVYNIVLLSEKTFFPEEVQATVNILLGSPLGVVAVASSFLMQVIPFIVLVYAGVSLLVKKNLFTAGKSVVLAVVWIVAVVLAVTASALQVEQVMQTVNFDKYDDGLYDIQVDFTEEGLHIDAELILSPENMPAPPVPPARTEDNTVPKDVHTVICTEDAKICPDGSVVGRSGPSCEFANCR